MVGDQEPLVIKDAPKIVLLVIDNKNKGLLFNSSSVTLLQVCYFTEALHHCRLLGVPVCFMSGLEMCM